MNNVFITPANPVRRTQSDSIYVRETAEGFELVAQHILLIGDDFTIDDVVLATGTTPRAVLDWLHAADIPTSPMR